MIGGKNIVPNNQKIIDQLSSYQEFCNQLKRFDGIAKLKNLPFKLVRHRPTRFNKKRNATIITP